MAASQKILLVEDEYLIRMLLEDMLDDLGYSVVGAAGNVSEASKLASSAECDVAILDVSLDGQEVFPVADILANRGLPFVFVTGYGGAGLPEQYRSRPTLQKPFQLDELSKTLNAIFAQ